MRFPDFELDRAGEEGRRLRADELAGRPWIGYFARHPGCTVCRRSLRGLVARREEIRELGGEVVVIYNAGIRPVSRWFARSGLPADLPVVADPTGELHDFLGTARAKWYEAFTPRTMGAIARAFRSGEGGRWTFGADNWRLGADVVVDDRGMIVFQYLASTFDDRATPDQLVRDLQAVLYRRDRAAG